MVIDLPPPKSVQSPDPPGQRRVSGTLFGGWPALQARQSRRKGTIDIRVGGETVETVEAGGVIGELAMVDNAPRNATAIVMTDAELVPIDRHRFVFLVQQTPYFALQVMETMAARLRAMNVRH
jgi:Cyclic nucleotide-binding domain